MPDQPAPDVSTGLRLEAAKAAGTGDADTAKELLRLADEMDHTKNGSVPRQPRS